MARQYLEVVATSNAEEVNAATELLRRFLPQALLRQQQQNQSRQPSVWNTAGSKSVSTSTTRVATPVPPLAPRIAAKPRKLSKKTRGGSTPRPTPPPIPLPNPSDPPPTNFLRNQQALLGLAGLVSGVKPANLALQNTRGSTANNPIVVEDEEDDDRPTIGRHPPANANGVPMPSNLPVPSSDAILQTLINQKNIFPVVEALLRLASNGSQPDPQHSVFAEADFLTTQKLRRSLGDPDAPSLFA